MWHESPGGQSEFYARLVEWDEKQAAAVQARRCPCGGRLDRSDYPRKARGIPEEWDEAFRRRISLCCAVEGCRRRRTPASVRFFGRRVYAAAVVLALSAGWAASGLAPGRTVRRWREFFRGGFVATAFWRGDRSRFMPPVAESGLPGSLMERFSDERPVALCSALSFLAAITTESSPVLMVG